MRYIKVFEEFNFNIEPLDVYGNNLEVIIDDKDFSFKVIDGEVTFSSDDDYERAFELGIEVDDELKSYILDEYKKMSDKTRMKRFGFFKESLEFNDRKDELVNLTNDCLAYLKDNFMNFRVRRLSINRDKKTGYEIKITKYNPRDEDDIFFKWDNIKDDFIPFCEMLIEKSFEIYQTYFYDDDDTNKKCLTFNYDEIINDKIGEDITLYEVILYVK